MRCESDALTAEAAGLRTAIQDERATLATTLRDETAQTLAAMLLELTVILERDDTATIHGELSDLREAVRAELDRILHLVAGLDQRRRASQR